MGRAGFCNSNHRVDTQPVAPSFPLTPPESLPQDSTTQNPVRYVVIIILTLSGGEVFCKDQRDS